MPIKSEDKFMISETGNWNVAADYSRLKIMKLLYLCDSYENVARFGYDTMVEEFMPEGIPLDTLKIKGFERLVSTLIMLCDNTMFAMKFGGTKKELQDYEDRLKVIRLAIPTLYSKISKQNKVVLVLNNEKYMKVLDAVCQIKADINEPLNKNHLIFTNKEEFDPKAYKKSIMEDAQLRG